MEGLIDLGKKLEAIIAPLGTLRLGEREFAVKQASLADLVAVRGRIKAQTPTPAVAFGELVGSPIWEHLSPEDKQHLAREAASKKLKGEALLTEEAMFERVSEPEHCRYLAWLLLHDANPDLKQVALSQLITEDNAAHVAYQLLEQSGGLHLGNASS